MNPFVKSFALILLIFSVPSCAGSPDTEPTNGNDTHNLQVPPGRVMALPAKDIVEALVHAPNLGWHVGGWIAFVDAPGRRVRILASADLKTWEQINIFDRAGLVFGAVMWNPGDGVALQGSGNRSVLYKTNKGFREFTILKELPGRYVKIIPETIPKDNGEVGNLILAGSDENGKASILRISPNGHIESIARFPGGAPRHAADFINFKNRSFIAGGTEGKGCLYVSDDNANYHAVDVGEIPNLLSIAFDAAGNGITVGDNGECLRSTDGGATWKPTLTGTEKPLASVVFTDKNIAFVCGRDGLVMITKDGGVNFEILNSGRREDFIRLQLSPANDGCYALGANGVIPFFVTPGK
ncbi:MAG: WD40/YVTN/BNR-like repeat-containing protein [Planctomycetota bacterium]